MIQENTTYANLSILKPQTSKLKYFTHHKISIHPPIFFSIQINSLIQETNTKTILSNHQMQDANVMKEGPNNSSPIYFLREKHY